MGEGGDRSQYIPYDKIDYSNYKMTSAHKWFNNLTEEEKKEWHMKQGEKRCKGWWISTIDDPDNETYVKNLREWCDKLGVDTAHASRIANPNAKEYGKSLKGYRIRKDWNPPLPPYEDGRKTSKKRFKGYTGKTWKLIDGKRVWITDQ